MQGEATLSTPVVFMIFNRPETTERVFAAIREARPRQLAARAIIDRVDWRCEVLKNYSEANLGCKKRVSSGLDWAFGEVEEAIILEDDCLPNRSFFAFCAELLARYRHDERVMNIGGTNFQHGISRGEGSYYFSYLNHIWGWASWRRAWQHYDVSMTTFPRFLHSDQIGNTVPVKRMQQFWLECFDKVYRNKIDTWDYQWTYAMWRQNGLAIIPNVNMVSNIGFGQGATHTHDADNLFALVPTRSMDVLQHPSSVVPDIAADRSTFRDMTGIHYLKLLRTVVSKFLRPV